MIWLLSKYSLFPPPWKELSHPHHTTLKLGHVVLLCQWDVHRGGWAEAFMPFCGWLGLLPATMVRVAAAISGLVSEQKTQTGDLNPSSECLRGHIDCGVSNDHCFKALRFEGCLLVQHTLINMSSQISLLFYNLCQFPTLNLPGIQGQLFGCVIYKVTNGLLV